MSTVLVDTSIWVNHFRNGHAHLSHLLDKGDVVCHPFVIGELACGNLRNRVEILSSLKSLPSTPTVAFDEYLHFLDHHRLYGVGIGFVDVHLLAATILFDSQLWTADIRLKKVAEGFGIAYEGAE